MDSDSDSFYISSDNDDDLAILGDMGCDLPQPSDVDSLAARDLANLSAMDREQVYHDIHGVSADIKETPQFIREKLALFDKQLCMASATGSEAYQKALAEDPEYVRNEKFRLSFLRCDRFDVKASVKRFFLHFTVKLHLFGPGLLVKTITQDDLDEDAKFVLHNRIGFDLPVRDMGGRLTLMISNPPNKRDVSIEAIHRRSFYCAMVFAEDEETQRKGVVSIVYNVGQPVNWKNILFQQTVTSKWGGVMSALPLKIDAVHLCSDSLLWRSIFALFKFGTSSFTRVRAREHYGNHKEILFKLQTFGIQTQYIPILDGGFEAVQKLSSDHWKKRQHLEQSQAALKEEATLPGSSNELKNFPSSVVTPGQDDVLLGRGKAFYSHTGNQRLRYLILERFHLYQDAMYSEKKKLNGEIVGIIRSKSGRFLKDRDGIGWVEVDEQTARNKVGHLFRQVRKHPRFSRSKFEQEGALH